MLLPEWLNQGRNAAATAASIEATPIDAKAHFKRGVCLLETLVASGGEGKSLGAKYAGGATGGVGE
jgi:hypothetical protein